MVEVIVEVPLMVEMVLVVSSEVTPPITVVIVEMEAFAFPALVKVLVCRLVDPPET